MDVCKVMLLTLPVVGGGANVEMTRDLTLPEWLGVYVANDFSWWGGTKVICVVTLLG